MEINHIRQLPPEVIGQIAAGEVVERPAAAIKELVENSMDAGATAITVDIKEGGLTSFRVADNGSGIQPSDIKLAFARHATSKIRKADDLYGVKSLGFRGEALASIAAVAKVTCLTRARGLENGLSVRNEGGEILEIKDAACPEGTTFTIKDLFFNAPVRKKFLKKPATETAAVSELMARMILSHPSVSFRFMADNKLVYFSPGDGKLESAIMSVYGVDTLKLLTKVEGRMNGVSLSGFVGVGDAARGNRSHEHFYLNGRAMKSALLSAGVETACRQRITIGRFPLCVLHLSMPFENADVNVHPNKWEVRFSDERGVRQAVETIVFEALEKTNLSPVIPAFFTEEQKAGITGEKTNLSPVIPAFFTEEQKAPPRMAPAAIQVTEASPAPAPASMAEKKEEKKNPLAAFTEDGEAPLPFKSTPKPVVESIPLPLPPMEKPRMNLQETSSAILPPRPVMQVSPVSKPLSFTPFAQKPVAQPEKKEEIPSLIPAQMQADQIQDALVEEKFSKTPLKIVGVAFNTYIIMEYGDIMILCDQHAAHERLLFEKFMRETKSAPASQAMLFPLIVQLSKAEYAAYEENAEALENAGFDLSPFGDDAVQLRGVPIVLGQPQAEKCLIEALDDLIRDSGAPLLDRTQRVIQMACKHAVKGGERLPEESILSLIRDVMEQKVTPTCPHGRPLMVQFTHAELDKRFRRIQN